MLQGVRTFLFSLSSFWPLADRFTSAGTPATERWEGGGQLHCSSREKKTRSLSVFNNKLVRIDCYVNINNFVIETLSLFAIV